MASAAASLSSPRSGAAECNGDAHGEAGDGPPRQAGSVQNRSRLARTTRRPISCSHKGGINIFSGTNFTSLIAAAPGPLRSPLPLAFARFCFFFLSVYPLLAQLSASAGAPSARISVLAPSNHSAPPSGGYCARPPGGGEVRRMGEVEEVMENEEEEEAAGNLFGMLYRRNKVVSLK